MQEKIVTDTIEKPVFRIVDASSGRCNMREVYRRKSAVYKLIKRLMDVLLSALALVIFSPVFLVTAVLIKREDRGPVFFCAAEGGKGYEAVCYL